jgi:hypothetical protein
MIRLLVALAFLGLITAAPADAKDVASIVVVGSDGRSIEIGPERAVLAVMLYHPASVYNVRPKLAKPRGGYVRIYPLGPRGLPAIPGRFYPATRALCFGWNQALAPRSCGRGERPRRLLTASRRLAHFHGRSTILAVLDPGGSANLFTALELAFDRYRSARKAPRPAQCLPFVATWFGARAAQRPRRICVSRRGIYAGGWLYPAGASAWSLALDGPLRGIARAGVSALYPRGWHVQTIERHVVNPRLRFQISTDAGEDGASVSARGAVIRVEELLPPLLTRRGLREFPLRPHRFDLRRFDRMDSWPRGRGTRFRERGRAVYVWVALGQKVDAATRGRVLAVLDSIRVTPKR